MEESVSALTIDQLNETFGVEGRVSFKSSDGGLPVADITASEGQATIYPHGGHVATFQPTGEDPVLWMSGKSHFESGKPIRGGIPVCWPWFGPHPTDSEKPAHGFARTSEWTVVGSDVTSDGEVVLRLELRQEDVNPAWSFPFSLILEVTVGRSLSGALTTRNLGDAPMSITEALHSYFTVSDVSNVEVQGLENTIYEDALDDDARRTQQGPIRFAAETDRVYVDTEGECRIVDPGLNRVIRVSKQGSRSTVVWNPWTDKSIRMPDFGDDEFHGMLCVETANARGDAVTIQPGQSHRARVTIRVEGIRRDSPR